ncbi:MAG: SURF1 family protein [Chloroflexi bacterium]|nr:SURF1 family protein [Chloroflexota bacterium]
MILKKMFSRGWLFATLLVFAGTALCIRLGIWQLDRLEQRRAFNSQVESMRAAELLDLNQNIPAGIFAMEWRAVTVTGEYDFENQVVLRNQYVGDQYGYHLITPLLFDPSTRYASGQAAVLVDRGWIPASGNTVPKDWRQYDEAGQVTVTGQIRLGQDKPAIGGVADAEFSPGQARLDVWNNLNVVRISEQSPYPLLPVYVQPNPDENNSEPPIKYQPVVELTKGSHFGYALQWFVFAAILFVGYPFYLRKQE